MSLVMERTMVVIEPDASEPATSLFSAHFLQNESNRRELCKQINSARWTGLIGMEVLFELAKTDKQSKRHDCRCRCIR